MNANQNSTPPRYSASPPLLLLFCRILISLAFEMYQNQHIKQAHCICVGVNTHTHAHTQSPPHPNTHTGYPPNTRTHTRVHLKHATIDLIRFGKLNGTVFPRNMSFETGDLDTSISFEAHLYRHEWHLKPPSHWLCCWQGMEDQLCRSVECWWVLTPHGLVLDNSNNSEPEYTSLFKKKKKRLLSQLSF